MHQLNGLESGTKQAEGRYTQLLTDRESFLQRARESAELTIPMLMPPDGHTGSTVYNTPYQSVGSRGTNNLASKLLMALLPPNSPFFRLTIDDHDLEELGGKRGEAEEAMSKLERIAMSEIESSAIRVPVFEALKQLIVSGNALVHMPRKGQMKVFRLDRYCVKRDTDGNLLEIVVKETVSPRMLPQEVLELLPMVEGESQYKDAKNLDLFTYVCRVGDKFHVHQEVKGLKIPSSIGEYPVDKSPWLALRFTSMSGEDYGRGLCEEFIGDLKSLEALTQAIVEGSAASAKVLFLVRPNGTTRLKTLAEAPNGGIVQGDANDVTTLQTQKQADLRVAQDTAQTITERLGYAFLLSSSVTRNAERVTAEEIRMQAKELEAALGGVYSVLSMEFQMPLVKLILDRMERAGKMPKFPKDTLKPSVVTGIEALGRGNDLNNLMTFIQSLQPLGPEMIAKHLMLDDYIDRLGASLGIDTNGLIKSQEQLQMETQQQQAQMEQQQQQQMMMKTMGGAIEKSAPVMVKSMGDGMGKDPESMQKMMKQMMGQGQQNG